MNKTLHQVIDEIVIYGGEDGDIEWTLGELSDDDSSWDVVRTITSYLESLKRPVPKKLTFGDTTPIENTKFNDLIDQLVMDIEEGKL